MSSPPFCHLHVHTEYSLLDGACRIAQMAQAADRMGMPAVAVTDHGNMFGVVEFCDAMHAVGIKPIIGLEAYLTPGDRRTKASSGGKHDLYHTTLLAADQTGYQNLVKLSSLAYVEGFYYKPRVDLELLAECAAGLICMSGCLQSWPNQYLLAGAQEEAEKWLRHMKELFADGRLFVELQDHGLKEQKRVLPASIKLAHKLDVPLVVTNDCHFLHREDRSWHDVLLCISTGKLLSDPDRFQLRSDELYFKSPEEMAALFRDYPEAVANTVRIAEMCNVELDRERKYPSFKAEDRPATENPALLRELAAGSLQERYGELSGPVQERLDSELRIIEEMGYADYFLIVWDFVRFARERRIPVGMRGSGGGSLVAHGLGLTDINPMDYDLIFNRFLDPQRREPPDIDIDLCEQGREEVIEYVRQRYGAESTAQVITFGTLQARNCVRDVGRVLDVQRKKVDEIAKMIPVRPGMTLAGALEEVPELSQRSAQDEEVKRILDYARSLEGFPRHVSTHAAGVVIADRPLWELIPLYRSGDGAIMTQWPMGDLEKMGMLKMDFLGVRTLTIIDRTLKLIGQCGQEPPSLDASDLDLTDKETYRLLCEGHTRGIFQLGSEGMQQLLRKLRPSCMEDLIAVVALYRPGPLQSGMVTDFIARKYGQQKVDYPHAAFEPILEPTYGLIVYQEQIMRIVNKIAGMSMADALTMIKAISKKKQKVIEKRHQEFVEGAVRNGVERGTAEEIFSIICHFAGYGFNKAHASAYAFVGFRTAFLKAHYPTQFMAATMSCEMGNRDKIVDLMEDCGQMGIQVLAPDINQSGLDFTVAGDDSIRFGLAAIKNVGLKAADSIIAEREERGMFGGLFDFCERVEQSAVTRGTLEGLVKAGCFDALPGTRAQQLAVLERAMSAGARARRNRMMGQRSLFASAFEDDPRKRMEANLPDVPPVSMGDLARQETEALGLHVRYDPLREHRHRLERFSSVFSDELSSVDEGCQAVMGGIIEAVQKRRTRDKRPMAVLKVLDSRGGLQCVLFPDVYASHAEDLQVGRIVFFRGTISHARGTSLRVDQIVPLEEAESKLADALIISVSSPDASPELWDGLKQALRGNEGRLSVYVDLVGESVTLRTRVSNGGVRPSPGLAEDLDRVLQAAGRFRYAVAAGTGVAARAG